MPHVHVTAADSVGCRVNHGAAPPERIPNANCHLDNTIDSINDRVVGSARVQKFVLNGQVGVASHDDVGNPFFAEEMVRELVQRGVLAGERGGYVCRADVAEVSVPATVQAAIEARIDRLSTPAKRTLNAASVIGARFGAELLAALGIDPVLDELLDAELIDQVRFTPSAEYAFRHPLIRAVAYESQLKSDRAQWHRRLAAAIQESEPGSVEENAALIAEHLEAAGELRAAYGWHMRAGAWSTNRDLGAARLSWERARRIADALPADDPDQLSMRIAPRTMLCATDWQGPSNPGKPGPLRGAAGVVQRGRGQGLAGHRHDRAGNRARSTPGARVRGRGWHPNRWRCSSRSAIPP